MVDTKGSILSVQLKMCIWLSVESVTLSHYTVKRLKVTTWISLCISNRPCWPVVLYVPSVLDVDIGLSLRHAPCPFCAVNSWSRTGLYTMPITTCFFIASATEIQQCGVACTKLVVPSIGSISHVGSSVNVLFSFDVSSPMNL